MADEALEASGKTEAALRADFGPVGRVLGARYFDGIRFPREASEELRALSQRGFVVHVMRTTAWVNFLYLAWALVRRGLPPLRAVVNLRPWFTRPFVKTAQRGDFQVRFTYARRQGGSGLIFLKRAALLQPQGKDIPENPFPALVAMARRSEGTVFLVPELFVWDKRAARLQPGLRDVLLGGPEAPGFLLSLLAFFRNYKRAQFRVGQPIDLKRFIEEHPLESDETLARKVKAALHHHLARETRAVLGPPAKHPERLIEETLRDRVLRHALDEEATRTGRRRESVEREATRALRAIAARPSPAVMGLLAPLMDWVFRRIYDGIEVDEAGLERAIRAATHAPLVLCPSHKSHVDYLVLHWVLWNRGYMPPVVAAGANLSFFPLGPLFRRGGAFFLRRSFKGDRVYTAAFRAYVKKLVHDGIHQEFFPEGGRSRTGKLLQPKLGLFTWQVDALLEGAAQDLVFVPVAIDYEKVVEGGSYSRELAGGEKKPEDLRALLSAPKVLSERYGRIHVSFDAPLSLLELMRGRGLEPHGDPPDEEQKKGLVRALGNRVMYGITRVSTVTPHALVSAALLAHRQRGLGAPEVEARVALLRRIAAEEGVPLSRTLEGAPSTPAGSGPIQEAVRTLCADGLVRTVEAKAAPIYQAQEERRLELSFYKNTLMNLVASRSLVASALLAAAGPASVDEVRARALFLSRLFKLEFTYRVGTSFEALFGETLERLAASGLVVREGEALRAPGEAAPREALEFLADLLRDLLETYLLATLTLRDVAEGLVADRKAFVRAALENGRAEYHAGRIAAAEALSRPALENAFAYLLEQQVLVEGERRLAPGPAAPDAAARAERVEELRRFLRRS